MGFYIQSLLVIILEEIIFQDLHINDMPGTLGNPNHYSFMLTVALLLLSRRFLILNNTIKIKRFYKSLLQIIIIVLILVICSGNIL